MSKDHAASLTPAAVRVIAAVIQRGDQRLICQRPPHKRHGGLWEFPGGKVEPNESDESAARRELAEELGVQGVEPVPLFTKVYDDGRNRCHNFAFEVRWDGPIRHQAEEIAEGRWIALEELRAWVDDPAPELPFIPDGREGVQEWFRRYG